MRAWFVGVLWTVLVAGAAAQAPTDSSPGAGGGGVTLDDARARRHFQAGRSLLDVGRFQQAADEFEEAYRLSGRHELLFNVYVAARDAGDLPRAASALERYLANVPDAPDRANLEARLATMRERVTAEQMAAEQRRQAEELARRREQEARAREAELAAERERFARERARRRGPPVGAVVLMGVGGAAAAASVATGLLALRKVHDLEEACPNDACPVGFDLESARAEARSLVRVTDVLWISGLVVAAGGVAWWLLARSGGDESRTGAPARATVGCTLEGCGASATWRF
ncbi:MAG: hypothetical protein NZ898_03870 [Myxococcota bacterium]|nr:hypothetical protein [Myxococcota bacterium]MDW8362941.1 tetratricopeptide repeat protein [Myxococcales bacterium]